jgi:GNAT superfamily N-acetyltransferase
MGSAPDRVTLRVAALSDSPALAALVTQLGYATTAADMKERLEHLLPHPEHAMVVAEMSGDVVGMVAGQVGPALEMNGVYGRVTGLVVDARWRGHGIGATLMRHIECWFRERGAHTIVLTSGHHRVDAHTFYKTMGYEPTGLRFIKRL